MTDKKPEVSHTDHSWRRYLNDENYFEAAVNDGHLIIYSECCADTFSEDSQRELFEALRSIHDNPPTYPSESEQETAK